MKKTFVFTIMVLLSLFFVVNTNAYAGICDWKLKSLSAVEDNPSLVHFVWESQRPPFGPLDRIRLHRVVRKDKMLFNQKVILMLPGTWNMGGWSKVTDPNTNTLLYLAQNSYDVYIVDYRTMNIQNLDYDQFSEYGIDISATTDWTYGVFREDIKACVDFIKELSFVDKMFMSGFSRGAFIMYIYASKYQDDLKGMVVLDYYIKDMILFNTPLDEATYNQVIDLFKAGMLVDPDTGQIIPWLLPLFFVLDDVNYNNLKLAEAVPYSKNLVGGPLPPNFDVISDYVADNAYHILELLYGEGALSNYYGGYIDRDVLVKILAESHRYYPNIQSLEDIQLFSYDDVPYFDYDDNDIYLPAIAFLTGYIGCAGGICLMDVIPNMTKSDDVTINLLEGYGHADILYGNNSLTDVKQPLLDWLNDHMDEGSSQVLSWQSPEHKFVDSLLKSLIKPLFQIEEN